MKMLGKLAFWIDEGKDLQVVFCNKCGKAAPIDEKSSNENWKVYNVKEPCECGGIFKIKFRSD